MSNKKSLLAIFLSLAILLTMVPAVNLLVLADGEAETIYEEEVSYIDENGNEAVTPKGTKIYKLDPNNIGKTDSDGITIITSSTSGDEKRPVLFLCAKDTEERWFYVEGEVSFDKRLSVNYDYDNPAKCTVNLILKDNCTLSANQGINVNAGKNPPTSTSTLNIFAQSTDPSTRGKLIADPTTVRDGDATIGAERTNTDKHVIDCGNINFYGGEITVTSYDKSVAIGGGSGVAGSMFKRFAGTAGGNITFKNCNVVAEVADSNNTSSPIGGGAPYKSGDGLRGAAAIVTVDGGCKLVKCTQLNDATNTEILYNEDVSADNYAHFNEPYTTENNTIKDHYPKVKKIEIKCYDEHPSYEYENKTETQHTEKCTSCDATAIKDHTFDYSKTDEATHKATCSVCTYSTEKKHNFTYTSINNDQHTVTCTDGCGYTETVKHNYEFKEWNDPDDYTEGHTIKCSDCGNEIECDGTVTYVPNSNHQYKCLSCPGTMEITDHTYLFDSMSTTIGYHNEKCQCGDTRADIKTKYKSTDDNQHIATCETCDLESKKVPSYHEFIYTDNGNGTHKVTCKQNCGYEKDVGHNFTYTENDNGTHTVTCTDGCGYTDNVDHNYVFNDWDNADDHTAGHTIKCSDCGKVIQCTGTFEFKRLEGDKHIYECSRCSASIEIAEHKYSFNGLTDGSKKHTEKCQCGAENKNVSHTFIATSLTHTFICPTCDIENKKEPQNHEFDDTSTCTICGYNNSSGHTHTYVFQSWVDDNDHTAGHNVKCSACKEGQIPCTGSLSTHNNDANNTHTYTCLSCGMTTTADHTTAYTVNNDGTHTKGCSECTYAETPEPHNFGNYTYNKDATCTKSGTKTGTCVCGKEDTKEDTEHKAIGHSYKYIDITADTHTEACIRCGDRKKNNEPHSFGAYEYNNDATCARYGTQTRICSVCGKEDTIKDESQTRPEHSYKYIDITADTHTEACTRCGYRNKNNVAHKFENYKSNKDATCARDGTQTGTCVCGKEDTKPDDIQTQPEHSYKYIDITGTHHTKVCTTCGKRDEKNVLHTYGAYKYNNDATCARNGTKTETCVCGYKHTMADDDHKATGNHTFKYIDITATTHTKACTTCGLRIPEAINQSGPYTNTNEKSTNTSQEVSSNTISTIFNVSTETAGKLKAVADQYNVSAQTLAITDKKLTTLSNDNVIAGTNFGTLKATVTKIRNKSFNLKWTKFNGADGYLIYGNPCNAKTKAYKLVEAVSNNTNSVIINKLKKATSYKYLVVAYKTVYNIKATIAASVPNYANTTGGKYGNAKAVNISKIGKSKFKKNFTLANGKTAKITAKAVRQNTTKPFLTHRKLSFESSNASIATVTKGGQIKALNAGKCQIWVYAQNGVYKTINLTVK